jgi:hypothetical protein
MKKGIRKGFTAKNKRFTELVFYINGFQNSGYMQHMDVTKQGKTQ